MHELEEKLLPKHAMPAKPLTPMAKVNAHRMKKMWHAPEQEPHENLLNSVKDLRALLTKVVRV